MMKYNNTLHATVELSLSEWFLIIFALNNCYPQGGEHDGFSSEKRKLVRKIRSLFMTEEADAGEKQ